MTTRALQLEAVSFSYGETHALDGLDLTLDYGEIKGLVGANGAGKSTLLSILSGLLTNSTGVIAVDDMRVAISSPQVSRKFGIAVSPQEPQLAWNLSVKDNILLQTTCDVASLGVPRQTASYRTVVSLLRRFGHSFTESSLVISLNRRDLQILQLAIVIAQSPNILLLDEPTTALTDQDKATLFSLLGDLQLQHKSILFISHRIDDVLRVSSKIMVLKDGKKVCERQSFDVNERFVLQAMHGAPAESIPRTESPLGSPALLLDDLKTKSIPPTRLLVREGEIVGVLNEDGTASELFRAIMALEPISLGSLTVRAKRANFQGIQEATEAGLGFVPEDRRRDGLFPNLTIFLNIVVSSLSDFTCFGYFKRDRALERSETMATALRLKYRDLKGSILTLSGGNQQKVMLSRLLLSKASIMLLEEPTAGMDQNSKAELRHLLQHLVSTGKAILISSNDEMELAETCSRIVRLQLKRFSPGKEANHTHLNDKSGAS